MVPLSSIMVLIFPNPTLEWRHLMIDIQKPVQSIEGTLRLKSSSSYKFGVV